MNWTVTYRDKSGKQTAGVFDADSRESLFKTLAENGISVIRVKETKSAGRRSSKLATMRPIVWTMVGLAVAVGAFLLIRQKPQMGNAPIITSKPTKIREAMPQIVPKSQVEEKAPEKPVRFWEVDAAHTNGFTEMQMRKWRKEHMPPPGYTNNAALMRPKPKYAIFNHKCENLIAAYLTLKPGEGMIGSPVLGERFRQQFLKSLEEPIVVTAEDSPENARLKQDMIATKIDLKARMDAGEDICKIIADTHKEVQDLARYRSMLRKEIHNATKNPDMTMQDVDDLVEAANRMLDAKGIAPITLGPITRRLIQRRKGF